MGGWVQPSSRLGQAKRGVEGRAEDTTCRYMCRSSPYPPQHAPATPARRPCRCTLLQASRFTEYGVKHHELYFPDGTCPSEQILLRFLELAERETGALAVGAAVGLCGGSGAQLSCAAAMLPAVDRSCASARNL